MPQAEPASCAAPSIMRVLAWVSPSSTIGTNSFVLWMEASRIQLLRGVSIPLWRQRISPQQRRNRIKETHRVIRDSLRPGYHRSEYRYSRANAGYVAMNFPSIDSPSRIDIEESSVIRTQKCPLASCLRGPASFPQTPGLPPGEHSASPRLP